MNNQERMDYLYQTAEDYRAEAKRWRVIGLMAVLACLGIASAWAAQIGGLL